MHLLSIKMTTLLLSVLLLSACEENNVISSVTYKALNVGASKPMSDTSDLKEYLYVINRPDSFIKDSEKKNRKQKDVKISEMTILGKDVLMILERVRFSTKLFKVDLTHATPVPVEISSHLEIDAKGAIPVSKVKVFDTDEVAGFTDKIEAIANLGHGNFLLINDNDFGISGEKTVMQKVFINTENDQ